MGHYYHCHNTLNQVDILLGAKLLQSVVAKGTYILLQQGLSSQNKFIRCERWSKECSIEMSETVLLFLTILVQKDSYYYLSIAIIV